MMTEEKLNFDLLEVKSDLVAAISECNKRGLVHSGETAETSICLQNYLRILILAKWLAELSCGLQLPDYKFIPPSSNSGIAEAEYDTYCLAKSFFDIREYDRASYFTRECTSSVPKFLNLYSMYMAKEKKRLDNSPDNMTMSGNSNLKDLSELMSMLNEEYNQKKLDGYGMYLYGVILKKLDLTDLAVTVLLESLHLVPTLWSTWVELAPLIQDADQLRGLALPKHWIKPFFIGELCNYYTRKLM